MRVITSDALKTVAQEFAVKQKKKERKGASDAA
jgi:hypothetical protein